MAILHFVNDTLNLNQIEDEINFRIPLVSKIRHFGRGEEKKQLSIHFQDVDKRY